MEGPGRRIVLDGIDPLEESRSVLSRARSNWFGSQATGGSGGKSSRVTSTSWKEVEGKVMEKVGI